MKDADRAALKAINLKRSQDQRNPLTQVSTENLEKKKKLV